MPLLQVWLCVPLVALAALALRHFCRLRHLPLPPLVLLTLATVAWALANTVPAAANALPAAQRLWLSLTDDLLLAFAAIRLLIWLGLEIPGGFGWWRQPPELMVQLLSLGASATAAALILQQGARLDLLSLITTSAVLTAVVGLAAQEALKDLISGLELQLSDDFCVGDWIELASGQHGIVTSLTWRDCSLRTFDDVLLVVPNSKITADVLNNRSHFGRCAQRIKVGLDYSYPPARAQQLLSTVVEEHPDVLSNPSPRVRLASFDDSAITYEIQVWNRSPEVSQADLRSALLSHIWYALQREGQSIPYPVRQVEPRRARPVADLDAVVALERGLGEFLSTGIFADLSADQRSALVQSSQALSYGPGELIVREGSGGDSLYVVLSGRVEVSKQREESQVVVGQLGEGEVFGEMTLLLDTPRSATVRALQECRLLQVGRPSVRALVDGDPALLKRFATLISARQAELEHLSLEEESDQRHGVLATMRRLFHVLAGP